MCHLNKETGKSIPDISILKEICNDYNIDMNELLKGNKKKFNRIFIVFIILIIALLILLFINIFKSKSDDFNFKSLSTACEDFNLFGSIAYNDSKTYIYISNITYCGDNDDTIYKKINCTLYQNNNDTKTVIDSFNYNGQITLEEFLNKVTFNIEHLSKSCKMYEKNALHLEIEAITLDNKEVYHKIPLILEDCN